MIPNLKRGLIAIFGLCALSGSVRGDTISGINIVNWPDTYACEQYGPWSTTVEPDAEHPLEVSCVSGCSGSGGSSTSTWVNNFPQSYPVTGTFWPTTQPVSGSFYQSVQPVSQSGAFSCSIPASSNTVTIGNFPASQAVTGSFYQATQPVSIASMPSTPVTGTFWQATQPVSVATPYTVILTTSGPSASTSTVVVNGVVTTQDTLINGATTYPLPLTKGTQGANGYTIQQLKDAGRTAIVFYVTASTVGATTVESALNLTMSSGTAATTTAESFVIPSGKTLRITSIVAASLGNATATAQNTRFSLRMNTAAGCITSSTPVLWQGRTATAAVASAYDRLSDIIPDGMEIYGNGTISICASVNSTFVTNAPTADMIITGYQY